ncbi:PREDICTED: putative cyclin-D6-1 [Lupinus angustifolius]|uniref:putative cyclin-D6-1 n=1 Tax=Lupinus angustifolius TaxID=3871 RepID=UPI00092E72B5|nr:PREDICTED: putative cyclin-D6-1 [Lupinus angustifolius]
MEFDLENPLANFEEHQNCTISQLFASESDHMLSPNSLALTHSHVLFRCEAVSLILQVQFSCNLDPFVTYLAINFLHRFMSRQEIPQGKPWLLRHVAISCLSLASKMKNVSLSLSDIQNQGCVLEAQCVHRMELLILGALNWRMRSITPFPFLNFFLSLAEFKDQALNETLKERASEIIFNAQNDIKLLEYKPSTIAASALMYASHELLSPPQYSILRASNAACEYLDEDTLSKCFKLIQKIVMMEAKDSMVYTTTSFLSSETPMSVLERSIKRQRI